MDSDFVTSIVSHGLTPGVLQNTYTIQFVKLFEQRHRLCIVSPTVCPQVVSVAIPQSILFASKIQWWITCSLGTSPQLESFGDRQSIWRDTQPCKVGYILCTYISHCVLLCFNPPLYPFTIDIYLPSYHPVIKHGTGQNPHLYIFFSPINLHLLWAFSSQRWFYDTGW